MNIRNPLGGVLFSLVVAASGFTIACSDGGYDSGASGNGTTADRAAIEEIVRSVIDAFNRGDIQTFLSAWTDEGLEAEFGATRGELIAAAEEFFGGPERQLRSVTATNVEDDNATVETEFALGRSVSKEKLELRREDGAWKLTGTDPLEPDLASSVDTVEVEMDEFVFRYDMDNASSGNIAFKAENAGDQAHELALIKIPAAANVQQLLQQAATSPVLPPGVEVIGGIAPGAPGEEGWLAFTSRLDPGRYLMACFLPDTSDPQLTPHVAKGMMSEFNVSVAGGGR